nr:RNA-dependent RNA polymerase [ssRNA positive-strand virus sp.]
MSEHSDGEMDNSGEIPCKIDSELPLDYDLRLNELGKIFSLNDDITNEILRQQLYSKEENYLKNVIGGLMTEKLTSAVKKKTYIESLNIDECLDTNQENLMIQAFPEFKLNFRRNRVNAHSIAAAFRKCETHLILNKLQYDKDLKVDHNTVLIKDVGGNFLFHINNSNHKIHTCAPILSKYDQSRFTSRMYDINNMINSRKNLNQFQRKMLADIHTVVENNSLNTYSYCMKKSQNCSVKAKALMFIHSNYDMTLLDIANSMDLAEATIAYGTFIFMPKMFLEKSGYIESLGVDFEYLDPKQVYNIDKNNVYKHYNRIRFSFRNDSSYNYTHKTSIYFSYIAVNTFYSSKGNAYNLELQENRNGIQVFKITKHLVDVDFGDTLTHKIYFNILDKIKIKFFDLDSDHLYNFSNKIYPHENKSLFRYFDNNYYASALKETSFFADKDIVEKTINFAIGVSESKFKPDELFNYIRSVCTRQIVANGVIRVNSNLSSIEMKALANAVYIYVYDLKYRYGKVTQQIISDINWNREYLDRGLLSKYFGPGRKNHLINNNNIFRIFHRILYNKYKVDISGDSFISKPKLHTDFEKINSYIYTTYVKGKILFKDNIQTINVRVEIPDTLDSDCMIDFKTLAKQIYRENFNLELNLLDTVTLDKPIFEIPKRNFFSKLIDKICNRKIQERYINQWEEKCNEYELRKHIIDVHNKLITIKDNFFKLRNLALEFNNIIRDNDINMIYYMQKLTEFSFIEISNKIFLEKNFYFIVDKLFTKINDIYSDYYFGNITLRKYYNNMIMIKDNDKIDNCSNINKFDYIFAYQNYDYSDKNFEINYGINLDGLINKIDEHLLVGGSVAILIYNVSNENLINKISDLLSHFNSFEVYCPSYFDNIGNFTFLIGKNYNYGIQEEKDIIKLKLIESLYKYSFTLNSKYYNTIKNFYDIQYINIFKNKFNSNEINYQVDFQTIIDNTNKVVNDFYKILKINNVNINEYLDIIMAKNFYELFEHFSLNEKFRIINKSLIDNRKTINGTKLYYYENHTTFEWFSDNIITMDEKENINNKHDLIFSYPYIRNVEEMIYYFVNLGNFVKDKLNIEGNLIMNIPLIYNNNILESIINLLKNFLDFKIYFSKEPMIGAKIFLLATNFTSNNEPLDCSDIKKKFENMYLNCIGKMLTTYSSLIKTKNFSESNQNNKEKIFRNYAIIVYENGSSEGEEREKIGSNNSKIFEKFEDKEIFMKIETDTGIEGKREVLDTSFEVVNSDSSFSDRISFSFDKIIDKNISNTSLRNNSEKDNDSAEPIEINGCVIKIVTVDIDNFEIRPSTVVDNNCLFNSITEHRDVELNKFRHHISSISDDTEVKKECQHGSMAGSMTIETFVKHYNIGVVTTAGDLCQVILPQKNVTPMRYIYLKFLKNHYDLLKLKCLGKNKVKVKPKHSMFSPLLNTEQLKDISKVINCSYIEMKKFLENDIDTNVIVNNLQYYCKEHLECLNNNFGVILNSFSHKNSEIIYLFFEEENIDTNLFVSTLNKYNKFMYRIVDIDLKGYLMFQIRKTTFKNIDVADLNNDIVNLSRHSCGKKKKFYNKNVFERTIRYCCKPKTQIFQVEDKPKYYDKAIIIKKAESVEKEERIGNTYIFEKNISVGCYMFDENFYNTIKSFVNEDDVIYIFSATVTLKDLFLLLKEIKVAAVKYLYKVEYNDDSYYPKFVTEQNELDYRLNCINEILEIWRYTTKSVKNQLDILIKEYNSNRGKSKDTSFGIIDVQNCKWVLKPVVLSDKYDKAYYNNEFIDFIDYCSKGKLSNNIRKLGKGYVYISKDTKLMLSDKLYERASKLKYDMKAVNRKLIIHNGAPGVGKTEFILNNHSVDLDKPINHIVLTNTRESAIDIRDRAKSKFKLSDNILKEKYRTGDSYLLNHYGGSSEVLWIDEGFMKHPGEWFIYGVISNAKEIHIMGDIAQIPYQERTGKNVHFSKYDNRLMATIKNMGVSYRCPLDIIYWLNISNQYDFKIQGKSNVRNSVRLNRISGINDIVFNKYDHILTFTQEEKLSILKQVDINYGNKVNTIHEYQGKQCNKIAIVRLINKANPIYDSKEHILVALSRHKVILEYLTVVYNDSLSKEINKIKNFSQTMLREVMYSGGGIIREEIIEPDKAVQLYTEPKFIRDIVMNHCYTGYIPYNFTCEYTYDNNEFEAEFLISNSVNSVNILQDFIDRVQPQSSVSYNKYDHQQLHENDVLVLAENFYFCELHPYKFNSRDYLTSHLRTPIQRAVVPSIRQIIKAFAERNGSVPNLQGTINEFEQAKTLIEDFKKTYIRYGSVEMKQFPLTINTNSIKEWLTTQPVSIKNLLLGYDSDFLLGNNLQRYNYILKRVAKIDTDIDAHMRYKSPQTIAYLDKLVNTIFCPLWRDIKKRLLFILKDNSFIYVDESPLGFVKKLNHRFPVSYFKNNFNKFLEIDFSKYDKSQKLIALLFETMIMDYFGVDKELIDIWIFLHIYTELYNPKLKFNAFVNYQRKSGDAATFIGNTLFLMAVIASVFDLNSIKFYAMFSGDDSLLFVNKLPISLQEKVDKLAYLYNLEAKLLSFATPYFCSKFLIPNEDNWIFVPDVVKLINKLGRNDLVDYQHVEEYRISFLDNLHYYKNALNYEIINIAVNDRYKIEGDHTIVYLALLNISKDTKNFKKLYYLEDNCQLLIDPSRPSLDI